MSDAKQLAAELRTQADNMDTSKQLGKFNAVDVRAAMLNAADALDPPKPKPELPQVEVGWYEYDRDDWWPAVRMRSLSVTVVAYKMFGRWWWGNANRFQPAEQSVSDAEQPASDEVAELRKSIRWLLDHCDYRWPPTSPNWKRLGQIKALVEAKGGDS